MNSKYHTMKLNRERDVLRTRLDRIFKDCDESVARREADESRKIHKKPRKNSDPM